MPHKTAELGCVFPGAGAIVGPPRPVGWRAWRASGGRWTGRRSTIGAAFSDWAG